MNRMLIDYENKYYKKLYEHSLKINAHDYSLARELAAWKKTMLKLWEKLEIISFRHPDISKTSVALGDSYDAEVTIRLGELSVSDIGVELVIPDMKSENGKREKTYSREFDLVKQENEMATYQVRIRPARSGVFNYGIRIYAKHEDLPHRQDFALVKWA